MKETRMSADKKMKLAGEVIKPVKLLKDDEQTFLGSRRYNCLAAKSDLGPCYGIAESKIEEWETAARASVPFFCNFFEKRYQRNEVVDALATAAMIPSKVTDAFAESRDVLLGAALWLLDYIDENELQDNFMRLLPLEVEEGFEEELPIFDDLYHGSELVLRVIKVLINRKKSCRQQFEGIMKLIKRDVGQELRHSFRDCLLDYFERFLQVRANVEHTLLTNMIVSPEVTVGNPALQISSKRFADLDETYISRQEAMEKNYTDIAFIVKTPILISAPRIELLRAFKSQRAADLMSEICVSDPYKVCAAWLLLESEGDLLTKLGLLTGTVLVLASAFLPWTCDRSKFSANIYDEDVPEYIMKYMLKEKIDSESEAPDKEPERYYSESQLFYLATGYILPRNRISSESAIKWFEDMGVDEGRSKELAYAAMVVSCDDTYRYTKPWDIPVQNKSETTTGEKEQTALEAEAAIRRAEDLSRQLKSCQQALYGAEREAKEAKCELQEYQMNTKSEHIELIQLREAIFNMRAEDIECVTSDESISFPWTVERRLMVFGGHDNWVNSMRTLLPGIRFYRRDTIKDSTMLKGVDVIWLQINAFSHDLFERITEVARREDIPLRYFSFSSPRKCAEQVVADEQRAKRQARK